MDVIPFTDISWTEYFTFFYSCNANLDIMSQPASKIEDPRCVKILHPAHILLSDLLKQLEAIGPIVEFHSLENITGRDRKVALCRYQDTRHADEARKLTEYITKTTQDEAIYSADMRSQVYKTMIVKPKIPINKKRLYCKLPWTIPEEDREVAFFEHFVEFGPLLYHRVVEDTRGRLSWGYVQYYNEKNAAVALQNSDSQYGAQYAKDRDQEVENTVCCWVCDELVDERIEEDHFRTCKWQYQRKMWQRKNSPAPNKKSRKANRKRGISASVDHSSSSPRTPDNIIVQITNNTATRAVDVPRVEKTGQVGHLDETKKDIGQADKAADKDPMITDEEITAEINAEDHEYLDRAATSL